MELVEVQAGSGGAGFKVHYQSLQRVITGASPGHGERGVVNTADTVNSLLWAAALYQSSVWEVRK